MIEITHTIQDPLGLHARPVALLFDHIGKHHSRVTVTIGDRSCDGRDIMGLMGLYGTVGETIQFAPPTFDPSFQKWNPSFRRRCFPG